MGTDADTPELHPRELADLSALADGTIDPARREEVRARIAASPRLSALYERERRVVELLHEVRATDRAPAGLRARIATLEGSRPARKQRTWTRTRWHLNTGGMFAGMVTAAVIVLALLLIAPGGTPGAPSVSQAAALGAKPSTSGPPSANARSGKLGTNVEDVYFPDWQRHFGWWASGARIDRLNGRTATTVYYTSNSVEIAYTIVGAPALKTPPSRAVTYEGGVAFHTLTLDGRLVVTWQRDQHTCVLSAPGATVPAQQLVNLAASS